MRPLITEFQPLQLELLKRGVVFLLASLSFACLLGQFAGIWSMHWFGCWILPPATLALAVIAWRDSRRRQNRLGEGDSPQFCSADCAKMGTVPGGFGGPRLWIVEGTIGGLVAAVAYDLYRVPFVLAGKPLFKVMDDFGRLLLGRDEPLWLVHAVGWLYHFSNGAALGIMLLAMVIRPTPGRLFWGAIVWALTVEFILLQTSYPTYFGLKNDGFFLFITASAHLIFGIALGLWLRRRMRLPAYQPAA